ncbi:hypothetical protein EIN_327750 [Entamoeba invadens IP1]|uniref:small monomeric GTPase n=1 Tax=Entamoeba invadens IP1 TaxID=370355 RepID=A0A0A1U0P9_ENTIV|nr:hypothetical protein EIN_327750 [Entamoeba invadens IP1]ELP86118.1 hypothetical protein EIN_327750 [Entamoeba invadens IP1]|eukprot:XP_004185464.1 hypothetical protein EIN_327750 [Entamoeba invadens IP1]
MSHNLTIEDIKSDDTQHTENEKKEIEDIKIRLKTLVHKIESDFNIKIPKEVEYSKVDTQNQKIAPCDTQKVTESYKKDDTQISEKDDDVFAILTRLEFVYEQLKLICRSANSTQSQRSPRKQKVSKDDSVILPKSPTMSLDIKGLSGLNANESNEIVKLNSQAFTKKEVLLTRRKKSSTFTEKLPKVDNKLFRVVFVGDENSEKTRVIFSYRTKRFPPKHVPRSEDVKLLTVESRFGITDISVTDTLTEKEHGALRKVVYSSADLFVVCFSLIDPKSFLNVVKCWLPEIQSARPEVSIVLCGTHLGEQHEVIPFELIENTITQNQICRYFECNTTSGKNVFELFEFIGNLSLRQHEQHDQNTNSNCDIV